MPVAFSKATENEGVVGVSMQMVAKLAGVSTSTVSRVVNDDPRVAAATAEAVRRAMRQISFTPGARRGSARTMGSVRAPSAGSIAVLVFGSSIPDCGLFERLLRGAGQGAAANDLEMLCTFMGDSIQLPPRLLQGKVDGLLLIGDEPHATLQPSLQGLACVWLVSDRRRPVWGDLVSPDHAQVAELAARYLIRQGHGHTALLTLDEGSGPANLRAASFDAACRSAGAKSTILQFPAEMGTKSCIPVVAVEALVTQLLNLKPMPTGLFIGQETLAPMIELELARRGVRVQVGGDVEMVAYTTQGAHSPILARSAVVDVCPAAIGQRAVEQLLWRGRNQTVRDRMQLLIEPILREPELATRPPDLSFNAATTVG